MNQVNTTYCSQKKGIILIMTSVNSPNKKGYVGFVGSQPTLLLFDACLNIVCKSNNVGCDPTNPTYPFLFGELFTNTCNDIIINPAFPLFFLCVKRCENN